MKAFTIVFSVMMMSIGFAQVDQMLSEFKKSGAPISLAELNEFYSAVDPKENAAIVLQKAFDLYSKEDEAFVTKYAQLPIIGYEPESLSVDKTLSTSMKKLLNEYLADKKETIDLLYQGAAFPKCRYPIDLTEGFQMLMPYLSGINNSSKTLQLQALWYIENKQPQKALKAITTSLQVCKSLLKEPILISFLVRIAGQGHAISSCERLFTQLQLTNDDLLLLDKIFKELEIFPGLERAFHGEMCMGIDIFEKIKKGDTQALELDNSFQNKASLYLYRITSLKNDRAFYLTTLNKMIKLCKQPLNNRIIFSKKLSQNVKDTTKDLSKRLIISSLMLPAIGKIHDKEINAIIKLRTARTAIAIERYRLVEGKIPEKLSDLVGKYLKEEPKDFDNNPLHYKKLPLGYTVYGKGENGKDDGGVSKESVDMNSDAWDITFTVMK